MVKSTAKISTSVASSPTGAGDEDTEYLDVFWGILRVPIACTKCGALTRTPSYWLGGEPSTPVCTPCFRVSIWGY